MKKLFTRTIALCLLLSLALGCLTGCGLSGSASNLTGTEKAKLLLANQRLDSSVLNSSLNMLTNGGETLSSSVILPNEDLFATLGPIFLPISTYLGTCNKNGNTYEWKAFDDYSNIGSFFESYMTAIDSSVAQTSAMIDYMKTDVNVVDKWVGSDTDNAILLSVEGTTDTLYEKGEGWHRICKRTTNANAENVYEMYYYGDTTTGLPEEMHESMVYIPGKRYEFSLSMESYNYMNLYLILEKIDGEWNMLSICPTEQCMSVTNLVTTSNVTYVYDYAIFKDSTELGLPMITLATGNRGCDLLRICGNQFTMYLQGYKGIKSMKVETAPENIHTNDGMYGLINPVDTPTILLSNGGAIDKDQTFANNTVTYNAGVAQALADGYMLTADFSVEGDNATERMNNFSAFLSETGITCKMNIDKLTSYAVKAESKMNSFLYSYSWNGYDLSTYGNIKNALNVDANEFQAFEAMYDSVKDNEFVNLSLFNQSAISNIDFAQITTLNKGTITHNDEAKTISVADLSMTISDNTLLDAETQYTICLAYAKKDANDSSQYDPCSVYPLASENYVFTTYSEGDSFTLTQTAEFDANVEFDTTEFDLVACIVSYEGIRISEIVTIE